LDNAGNQVTALGVRTAANLLVNALPRNVVDYLEIQTAAPGTDPSLATTPSYYGLLNSRAVLGKQVGSKWFVGLSTGLCFVNSTAFKENLGLQLEYRISPIYSAQAAVEPGTNSSLCVRNGTTANFSPIQAPTQLGFDLFRNWRF
jgi:hypothetical protein